MEQKSDQEQTPFALSMPTPKKNLNNSDDINIGNNKASPF